MSYVKTLQIVLFSMLEEMFKFNRHQYPQDFVLVFCPIMAWHKQLLLFPELPRQRPNLETYLDVLFPWDIDGDDTSFCHHEEENIFALDSKLQRCYWPGGFMDNPGLVVSVRNKEWISSMPYFS